jgi:hypothetical protein
MAYIQYIMYGIGDAGGELDIYSTFLKDNLTILKRSSWSCNGNNGGCFLPEQVLSSVFL